MRFESMIEQRIADTSSSALTRVRPWRPAAQRNLKNQWSKLAALRQDWRASSAAGRSHATSVVNSYLRQKNMDGVEFGVLKDMPDIRNRACKKLFIQQESHKDKLLSSYRDMVGVVVSLAEKCKSMRCYMNRANNSPLAQFSLSSDAESDSGDCGGIPVYTRLSISSFEQLASEILQMFVSELSTKRLLVMKFLSLYADMTAEVPNLQWLDEFYGGEFDDLRTIDLYSKENRQPLHPCIKSFDSDSSAMLNTNKTDNDAMEVHLTTWMVDAHIDNIRVDEIFEIVGVEMRLDFSSR